MALSVGYVESVQLYSGIERQPVVVEEAAGVSANAWYKGDLVKCNGAGLFATVATTGVINGIAGAAATGTDYTDFELALIDPAAIYLMRVEDGKLSARAYIGCKYGLNFTLGLQRVNIDETSAVDIYIVGIYDADKGTASAGINEGRVLVRFNYDIFIGV